MTDLTKGTELFDANLEGIDYAAFDGARVTIEDLSGHKGVGFLRRDVEYGTDIPAGWDFVSSDDTSLGHADLLRAWDGREGFKLYFIDGVPMLEEAEGSDDTDGFERFDAKADVEFEALDGREVELRNTNGSVIKGVLSCNSSVRFDTATDWDFLIEGRHGVWGALYDAWHGNGGWSLWVKDGLPLKRKMADTLEPGTGFKGKVGDCEMPRAVVLEAKGGLHVLNCSKVRNGMYIASHVAHNVEVLEVYGPGRIDRMEKEDK